MRHSILSVCFSSTKLVEADILVVCDVARMIRRNWSTSPIDNTIPKQNLRLLFIQFQRPTQWLSGEQNGLVLSIYFY